MQKSKAVIAVFVVIVQLFTLNLWTTPAQPKDNAETVMFLSDYQNADKDNDLRAQRLRAILAAVDTRPGLVVGGGDYQDGDAAFASDAGIREIKSTVAERWPDGRISYIFAQGNHDPLFGSLLINRSGLYEFDDYVVVVIDHSLDPWRHNGWPDRGELTKFTAGILSNALEKLADRGEKRPVFIVTHLPLHYTDRGDGTDNLYAGYIFDAVSASADKLDIVFLFGHNHSGDHDDYIGGAVNYIGKGGTMLLGGTKEEVELGFTYMNCGYVGYSGSDPSVASNTLTVSEITVTDDSLIIQKYSADGEYYSPAITVERTAAD